MKLPSDTLADVIDFPVPGSKVHNRYKLNCYRKVLVAEGCQTATDILDSAIDLHDIELVGVDWSEAGEPIFYLLPTDMPVQS